MKLFKSPHAIYGEISKMVQAEANRREDRATVSNFFNGAPPMTDDEAQELGLTINVNHLFGYTELADAKDQMFNLLIKPSSQFEVSIDAAPPGKRLDWEMFVRQRAAKTLKKLRFFKSAYEGCSGDASLHGEAVFYFHDRTIPLPRQVPLSKMLVPDSAPTDIDELTHFAIEHDLGIGTIAKMIRSAPLGWKVDALKAAIKPFYDGGAPDGRELDWDNLEELEYRRQENTASNGSRARVVPVYYFFQKRSDKRGEPWDMTMLVKDRRNSVPGEDKQAGCVLFEKENYLDNVRECLHPVFMDCIIGGSTKWHRVLGTGTLNYQLNIAIEMLINRAMQATVEGSMNLWQANDSATREDIERILVRHNGVIPEGMNLVAQRYQPNFGGMLEMIQFFRQQAARNTHGTAANTGDRNDLLEVQEIFQQNRGASRSNTRTSNWYDYLDAMWTEVWARLTNPWLDNSDHGASIIREFQAAIEAKGIPLFWLQPENVEVKAVRVVGDGLRSKEMSIAQYLSQNRNQYAPEVQPKITRLVTGLVLDDHRLAEELTPMRDEEEETPEQEVASNENSRMLTLRKPIAPKPKDIDELHIIAHMPALETLIADALQYQNSAFTPPQAEAFQVVGAHMMTHIQRIEEKALNQRNDPERQKARMFTEQLNQLAAMGDKLLNNMQQQQEGQQQQIDPMEQARLQLEFEKLQLQREKLSHSVEKWSRQQMHREGTRAFDEMMKLDQAHAERSFRERDLARKDVELAHKIAATGEKAGGNQPA